MTFTISMIGAGNMGGAMLRGWLANGFSAEHISVIDPAPNPAMLDYLHDNSINHLVSPEAGSISDVVLIAVKPQMLDAVLPDIKHLVGPQSVAVSVAAGKTLSSMEAGLGDVACARVMPNTPALVQRGSSVAVANLKTTQDQKERIDFLMQAIGSIYWVDDEALIDAVTALSGSGPAYAFYLAECMAIAGEKLGLPKALAAELASQTVSGAGELMRQSDNAPAILRENVTSPNGTTAAALEVLMDEKGGLEDLMLEAMMAAKKRSEELS